MNAIALTAEDAGDLEVLSARLQDGLAQVQNLGYLPRARRFAGVFNRYRWEAKDNTRVRAGLHIENVVHCRSINLNRSDPKAIVSLLAIRFTPAGGEDPGGQIELILSGGGAIRLTVEYISAALSDLGAPWVARGRPGHPED